MLLPCASTGTVWLMKDEDTEAQVSYLVSNLHTSPVGDLSVCASRPLFATCSDEDKTIRVWDYDTKKVAVYVMVLPHRPTTCAWR